MHLKVSSARCWPFAKISLCSKATSACETMEDRVLKLLVMIIPGEKNKFVTKMKTPMYIVHHIPLLEWETPNPICHYTGLSALGCFCCMIPVTMVSFNSYVDDFVVWSVSRKKVAQSHEVSLQWRHNGHDGVSNHQPHGYLLNRLFRRRSETISKLRVTGLCAGNSPVTGDAEFPAKRASNAENVSIW